MRHFISRENLPCPVDEGYPPDLTFYVGQVSRFVSLPFMGFCQAFHLLFDYDGKGSRSGEGDNGQSPGHDDTTLGFSVCRSRALLPSFSGLMLG